MAKEEGALRVPELKTTGVKSVGSLYANLRRKGAVDSDWSNVIMQPWLNIFGLSKV